MNRWIFIVAISAVFLVATTWADGPADNIAKTVRRIPKLGIEVSAEDRAELEKGLQELAAAVELIDKRSEFLPDVLIYHKAVHDALKYQEFFDAKEIPVARELLAEGKARAEALKKRETPWLTKPGPTVRGYISKIDGSVQPYGLVIPAGYDPKSDKKYRLDFWFHGRGETLSELNFINDRRKNPGQFTPPDTFVLHPYGRYCCANKFAGEIDGFEALEAVQKNFKIDENRINVRGFSMGGAACWQFATHYADRWCSAAPGAGFSETPDFLKVFQKEELAPTWWEKKLWHWYDCTDWAVNLEHLPTVAYSGDKDIQKQAADMMASAFKKEGLPELTHIIGPNTGHSYEAKAKEEINRLIDGFNEKGREPVPNKVHLVTYTLRYNKMHWLRINGIERHWERAEVNAEMFPAQNAISIKSDKVTELTVEFDLAKSMLKLDKQIMIQIDGQTLIYPGHKETASNGTFLLGMYRSGNRWTLGVNLASGAKLQKRNLLQGPIDDAFMSAFIFVKPTGKPRNAAVGKWVEEEMNRAVEHWRRQFRGEVQIKKDTEISKNDLLEANLILWGDPESNLIMRKVVTSLPIHWESDAIQAGDKTYSSDHHALIAIYPNPLQTMNYIVLNSSFTYRDYAYLNNARQVAKLPDWAVVDVRTPPDANWPGKIVDADFFDEQWQLQRTPHDN